MLEANVYDNFNPNYYNISDFTLPNGKKRQKRSTNTKGKMSSY